LYVSADDWMTWGWVSALVVMGMAAVLWAIKHRLQRRVDELEGRLNENTTVMDERQLRISRLEMELATSTQRLKKLKRLVAIDPLTGIANRRHFDRTLEREIRRARRERIPVSVIFCDLDGFKLFNDSQGHARGDDALVAVARALAETFRRGSELAARYGGEEFVVILPGVDVNQASLYAERLRRKIWRLEIPYAGAPVAERLTISAGVAALTPEELTDDPSLLAKAPEVLLNSADAALYRAKCLGRNRVAVKTSHSGPTIVEVEMAS
jgi:diguanylate cyclase (GGDEF)-like protein